MPQSGSNGKKDGSPAPKRIHAVKSKTEKVKDELEVAAAKLHLSNTALTRNLPEEKVKGDVKKALDENAVVEETVKKSAEELAHVKLLLDEEEAERHRLEQELAANARQAD